MNELYLVWESKRKNEIKVFNTLKVRMGSTGHMRKRPWKLAALKQKGKTAHTVFGMPLVTFTATITGVWLSSDVTVLILQGLQDRETPSPYLSVGSLGTEKLPARLLKVCKWIPIHFNTWMHMRRPGISVKGTIAITAHLLLFCLSNLHILMVLLPWCLWAF